MFEVTNTFLPSCHQLRIKQRNAKHSLLFLGHRESAFVHAVISAGSFYALSRACMEAKLTSHCHCSQEPRPSSLQKSFLWAGCGDNLPYGYKFSKLFMDAKEELSGDGAQDISRISRVLMNLHNNEAGRRVRTKTLRLKYYFPIFNRFLTYWLDYQESLNKE